MKTEYEATFYPIDRSEIRSKLKSTNATKIYDEFIQDTYSFMNPRQTDVNGPWVRVRKEANRITLAYKDVKNFGNIEDQKEIELEVNSLENIVEFLNVTGFTLKGQLQSKREKWLLNNCEVTIDEWPYLEPYVEIEGETEEVVKDTAALLQFDYSTAYFGSVDGFYSKKYDITEEQVNTTPIVKFNMDMNPFESLELHFSNHPIFQKLKVLDLPANEYAIFGSGPMFAHGIRKMSDFHDLDIIAIGSAWKKVMNLESASVETSALGSNRIALYNDEIEIFDNWGPGKYDIKELIENAELIEGFPFVKLEEVLKWKTRMNRDKDHNHIKLIEDYLNS